MEIQKFLLKFHLIVGIQLIFDSGILSTSKFSNSEVGGCNSTIKPLSSLGKYIVEPYFENHDSLIDSYFQDFISHKLPFGSCELLQDELVLDLEFTLHRRLIGEGSHRRLSSRITFSIQAESISVPFEHSCEAIIIERLPSGVFADPFELQRLRQRDVFMDAAVFGDLNLELPSVASNSSVVEIHMDVGSNVLSRNKNGIEINIELPLHARYAPIGEHDFWTVRFGAPDLLMRCSSIEGKSHNRSCLFAPTNIITEHENTTDIIWQVPCGITKHAGIVYVVTFLSAGVSTLLLVLTSIYYSDWRKS